MHHKWLFRSHSGSAPFLISPGTALFIFSPGTAPVRHSFTHLPPVLPHHLKTCWWRKTLQNLSFCFTSTSPLETVNSPSSIIYAFTCQYLGWNTIKYFLGWHNLQHHLQVQKSFVLTVAFQHFCKKCHYLRKFICSQDLLGSGPPETRVLKDQGPCLDTELQRLLSGSNWYVEVRDTLCYPAHLSLNLSHLLL